MLDRFRGRIMFPIHNHTGKVVGFTGRILAAVRIRAIRGKYVNSPETPIFQKSKLLYGFWKSKDAIREAKTAVLVEGQMDFLMSWQSGVKEYCGEFGDGADAGSSRRSSHRLADELIINYDSDEAGAEAAVARDRSRGSERFFREGRDDGSDLRMRPMRRRRTRRMSSGPSRRRCRRPNFISKNIFPPIAPHSERPKVLRNLRAVLQKLRPSASPVQQEFWFKKLAGLTGIAEKTLEEESKKTEGGNPLRSGRDDGRSAEAAGCARGTAF